jgi:hypothetical protein
VLRAAVGEFLCVNGFSYGYVDVCVAFGQTVLQRCVEEMVGAVKAAIQQCCAQLRLSGTG